MSRYRGRRYDDEPKLNIKKVIALILAIVVVILFVISIKNLLSQNNSVKKMPETLTYFAAYTDEKWGVINNKGEIVIEPQYEEMIIIPDANKDVFICPYDVKSETDYKTKIVNSKNEEILKQYDNVQVLDNYLGSKVWYEGNVLKYKENGKYGLIKYNGEKILNAEYDDIYALNGVEKSIIIKKDDKIGLLNNITAEIIIIPEYKEIKAMNSNNSIMFIVKDENDKFGIIGADRKVILENKYDAIENVCGNDMYVVKEGDETKIIDKSGETVLNSGFDSVENINGDRIIAKIGDKYTIINTKGEKTIDAEYEELSYIFSDFYVAKEDGKYGVIDVNEIKCIDFKYEKISYRKDADFIEAEGENYVSDIYDRNLNLKASGIVSEVNTELGYIKLRVDNNYKYYTFQFDEKTNTEILENNTLFLEKKDEKYGYKNKNGELVVDCIYDDAKEQNKFGYCAVKKDGVWGVLKSDGTVLLKPSVKLDDSQYVDFIGEWHLYKQMNLNVYTK